MFKNILIPVSSEFYSKEVVERGVLLAEKFKGKINLIYIIEEKTLNQTDRLSNSYRTPYEIAETKKEIIRKQKLAANTIIFDDAEYYLKNKKIPFEAKIIEGEFSKVVKSETKKNGFDLIMMGYEKECILNYRLLDEINIPIWLVTESAGKSILAVCSNLAPNKKVPEMSLKLSVALGWDLQMLYVVDTEDLVQVNEDCIRSGVKSERDLLFKAQNFIQKMEKLEVHSELVKGSLEKETIKAAHIIKPRLIIVGREQKKKGILGLPVKNIKRKLAEKCEYSILFLN